MVRVSSKTEKNRKKEIQTDRALVQLQQKSEEQYAAYLARKHGLFYVDLHLVPVYGDDVRTLPESVAHEHHIAIFHKSGKRVRIAITDPTQEGLDKALDMLSDTYGWEISLYIVSPSSLRKVFAQYANTFLRNYADSLHLTLSKENLSEFEEHLKNLVNLDQRINEIPTTEIINIILSGGVKMGASDIHIEPQNDGVRLRYRIDGVLQDISNFNEKAQRLITSRLKLMSHMKINIRNKAQDGHFTFSIDEGGIDVRISIIPGNLGETTVMRLLDKRNVLVDMETLGVHSSVLSLLKKEARRSDGMILTTGPTGSGKTTLLYSLINHINSPDKKIITIEDPVEYQIDGISQTEVSKNRDYTFAKGLRAIVRQDPDVILVGEIRDDETADIAINAALTGHLVLSTVHTNNAPATIPRLFELGVKPTLIPPATNTIMAQRLVRRLCECKEQYIPAQETIDAIKRMLSVISPKTNIDIPTEFSHLYRPKGCEKCNGTGYKGRIGIFEALVINEEIEQLILNMSGETEIMRAAIENGMLTMTQDGLLKTVEGTTSMDEVLRVTAEGDFLEEIYENLVTQSLARAVTVKREHFAPAQQEYATFEKIGEVIGAEDTKNVLPLILAFALQMRAADIHIEPQENTFSIRLRLDGVLQAIASMPITEYPALLGHIKLLSGIKTSVRQGVQDSRYRINLADTDDGSVSDKIDVRVSIILGGFGETVVMRLLNTTVVDINIKTLGIRKQTLDRILAQIKKPYGILLNTGPTGSGKTTTLYSLLKILNTGSEKIITVEDPIEYQLDGILQTQVNKDEGYTFVTALRSLLRQDPDIMMIGEIRDHETAEIAVQAALTGHLILSTLHTNDAVGSVQRLLNLQTSPDDIITSVNAMMAQRLVRKLCECKKKVVADKDLKERLESIVQTISKKTDVPVPPTTHVYEPQGCKKCNGIGFKGRTVISEIFVLDEDAKKMIAAGALAPEIKQKALENGMLSMLQDGAIKTLEGETVLSEVERVTAA